MIVRVVSYSATSVDEARGWLAERSDQLEDVLGLKRVEWIRQDKPLRAGAIMYFESPQDLRQYKQSHRYECLRKSIRNSWGNGSQPVREQVYRIMEVSA